MKKSDVQIGATYLVKVAGNLVPVKITREHDNGGWEGTSVKTGKTIRIKSPQRLRKALDDGGAASEPKPTKKKPKDETKKLSLLDAAAQVLARSDEPMNTKQMVERVVAEGLWSSPAGKTPQATLYSSILRELKNKGDDPRNPARFVKVERGKFRIRTGKGA